MRFPCTEVYIGIFFHILQSNLQDRHYIILHTYAGSTYYLPIVYRIIRYTNIIVQWTHIIITYISIVIYR